MSTVDFLDMGEERPVPAPEAEVKPKPRRGNAHPDFTPKDELRRQLEVERAENVVLREIASRARRNAALALAACLLLLAASVVRTFA